MGEACGRLRAVAFLVVAACAASAAAQDEPIPPPPPPVPRDAPPDPGRLPQPQVVDPSAPDFLGVVLGDTTTQEIVGDERVIYAVGGISQPVWIRQPGLEVRCESVVLWGHRERLVSAIENRGEEGAPRTAEELLGPVLHALYAEGRVYLKRDEFEVEADRVFLDFAQNRAYMVDVEMTGARLRSDGRRVPLAVRAEVIRGIARDRFRAEDASMTSCSYERPHLEFTTRWIEVDYRRDLAAFETAWWPTVRLDTPLGHRTPLLVLPKLGGRAGTRPVEDIVLATTDRFGTMVGVGVGGDIERRDGSIWGDWRLRPVYRSGRGPGIDGSLHHESERGGRVRDVLDLEAAYQRDTEDEDDFSERPFDGLRGGESQDDRGRVHLLYGHLPDADSITSFLGEGWRFDAEVSWYSDRGFLAEYERDAVLIDKQQETYAELRRTWGNEGVSIYAARRLPEEAAYLVRRPADIFETDFHLQTDYLPSVTYHAINEPLVEPLSGLLPVNLSVQAQAANLERRYGDAGADFLENRFGWESEPVQRGDLEARVTTPFTIGPVHVNPAFGGSALAVTDANGFMNAGTDDADDSEARAAGFVSLTATVKAHRLYDVRSDPLDLDGLRHVVSLSGAWFDRFHVDDDPGELQQNDLIDALVEQNVGSLRLRNRLQTRRGGEVVDWIDYEARFLYYFHETDARRVQPFGLREDFPQPLQGLDFPGEQKYLARTREGSAFHQHRARVQLLPNLWFVGEGDYDMQLNHWESTGLGVRLFVNDRLTLYAGRRSIHQDSAIWTVRADYRLSEKWGLSAEHQENTESDKGLRTEFTLYRRAHDYTIAMEFQSERLLDETSLSLAVYPHDWMGRKGDPFSRRRRLDFDALRWYQ